MSDKPGDAPVSLFAAHIQKAFRDVPSLRALRSHRPTLRYPRSDDAVLALDGSVTFAPADVCADRRVPFSARGRSACLLKPHKVIAYAVAEATYSGAGLPDRTLRHELDVPWGGNVGVYLADLRCGDPPVRFFPHREVPVSIGYLSPSSLGSGFSGPRVKLGDEVVADILVGSLLLHTITSLRALPSGYNTEPYQVALAVQLLVCGRGLR